MATNKRPSFKKGMTVLGTLVYPRLNAPDTKYKADGEYSAKMRLDAEASENLIKDIEAELAAYWPTAKAEAQQRIDDAKTGPAKAKAKKALEELKESDKSYKPAYDDDGEETGEYEFNFKMPAVFLKDKGKATEKKTPMRPDVFDSAGKVLKVVPEIWGGTTGHVAYELRPFSTAVGVGISLRLKAFQIIDLQQGGGSRDADAYGFGKSGGGYEGGDDAPSTAVPDNTDEPDADEDENF